MCRVQLGSEVDSNDAARPSPRPPTPRAPELHSAPGVNLEGAVACRPALCYTRNHG